MAQAPSNYPGEQRRRSTRIVQSVPVTVRGVDLLGQPFEERTSTLVLNFHGCKYASKHHLPKNTWLTLEISQEGGGNGRRCVRARVAWIQRPRTVRELFQIGVELETAENVWGIAFPPEDWQASTASGNSTASERDVAAGLTSGPSAADLSARPTTLVTYMERMVVEGKQQGQNATVAAEMAGFSATALAEASPLMRELQTQLQIQADKAVAAATVRADQQIRRAAEKIEREHQASTEALREEWRKEFEREQGASREQFASRLQELQQEYRQNLDADLAANVSQARELFANLEHQTADLRRYLDGVVHETTDKLERTRKELEAAVAAHNQQARSNDQMAALDEKAAAQWRERLQSEMDVARRQWDELLQSSLDNAVQRLVGRLAESAQSAIMATEQKMTARLAELGQPVTQAAAEARESVAGVRASLEQELARARSSLGDIEQAANRMSEYSTQLEAASQDTVNELQRRLEAALAAQTAELHRRAEGLSDGLGERVRPMLESAGQQFVARSVAEVETKLTPSLEKAKESLRQLAAREEQAEETLRVHRERLRQASEHHLRDSASQMATTLEQLRTNFEEARTEALAKWAEELDASGVRATHTTFEAMVKASEWYQKQAKASVESLVREAMQKAEHELSEKAADRSRQFSEDLNLQRGAEVYAIQQQLAGAAGEVVERTRSQLDMAAEAAASRFGEVLQRISDETGGSFAEKSRVAIEERMSELRGAADEVHKGFQSDAAISLDQFRERLSKQVLESMAGAQNSLAAELAATSAAARAQRDAYQQEWRANLQRLGDESAEQYEEHLRTVCDSWMVTSVRKLNEHGQDVIDSLTRAAEQAVRSTCSRVFDGLAEAMRDTLLGASVQAQAATSPSTNQTTGGRPEKHAKA